MWTRSELDSRLQFGSWNVRCAVSSVMLAHFGVTRKLEIKAEPLCNFGS